MGRKNKLSIELKLKAVKEYLDGDNKSVFKSTIT